MTLPFAEETYSVSELCAEIKGALNLAFPSVWVAGEVQRVSRPSSGHVYFELIEKGAGDTIVGKIDAALFRGDYRRVSAALRANGLELADGQQIRCRGNLDFFERTGKTQFVVREIDPVFALGVLAQRRRETLAALAAAGLLERNKALALPDVPLAIALVTSEGSAAYHDFLSTLRESGYGFRVLFLHAAVQGHEAERQIVSALGALEGLPLDCAVLVRGGGSRADLATFDGRALAEAVGRASFPVLTGLGHEIDQSIVDLVAHTALKTPTKAAEFLVARVARADLDLTELRRSLERQARERLRRAREAVARAERGLGLARFRLGAAAARLEHLAAGTARSALYRLRDGGRRLDDFARRLSVAGPRWLERRRDDPDRLAGEIAARARGILREARAALAGRERLCGQLEPARTLERGFSITRDVQGRLLKRPDQVAAGELITTQFAAGTLRSRVEER